MAKLDRAALRRYRDEMEKKYGAGSGSRVRIVVGMGTCGIAAGAREAWEEIKRSVEEFGIQSEVDLTKTGCMGLCQVEPTVEIAVPGMPTVIYSKVTAEVAKRLVRKHIIEKTMVDGHILDRPAIDIVAAGKSARGA